MRTLVLLYDFFRVHLTFENTLVGAKHFGSKSLIFTNELSAEMLRPSQIEIYPELPCRETALPCPLSPSGAAGIEISSISMRIKIAIYCNRIDRRFIVREISISGSNTAFRVNSLEGWWQPNSDYQ